MKKGKDADGSSRNAPLLKRSGGKRAPKKDISVIAFGKSRQGMTQSPSLHGSPPPILRHAAKNISQFF